MTVDEMAEAFDAAWEPPRWLRRLCGLIRANHHPEGEGLLSELILFLSDLPGVIVPIEADRRSERPTAANPLTLACALVCASNAPSNTVEPNYST